MVLCIAMMQATTGLLIGRLLTDQYPFLQMLHWAPTFLIPLLGGLSLLMGQTVLLKKISGFIFLVAVINWCVQDWKPKNVGKHDGDPVTIVHWTVEEVDQSRAHKTLQVAGDFETDFLCLVNINTILRLPWKDALGHLPYQHVQWPFLFASRWPITCEIVLRENHTADHPLNIAQGSIEHPGGTITFIALDCPSDPNLSRMATADRIRQILGESSDHMVFGDFNCPRGASSINHAFPNHTHAFELAGNGPIMTWPARFPVLHLDHLLLNDEWHCVGYRSNRPGVGDHLPQIAELIRKVDSLEPEATGVQ